MNQVIEILERPFSAGTRVTNCVAHMGTPLTERQYGCELCFSDVKNQLALCIRVNEFLNKKVDDAKGALVESGG